MVDNIKVQDNVKRKDNLKNNNDLNTSLVANRALAHCLQRRKACKFQNGRHGAPKCLLRGPKMADRVWKGIDSKVFGPFHQSFQHSGEFSHITHYRRVSISYNTRGLKNQENLRTEDKLNKHKLRRSQISASIKSNNKLGLRWAKLSSSLDWTLL